ncbi:hypothetical protein ACFV9P_28010 [Streptomyces sp. NPDC059892]|uniref:DUF6197 family protein n=1 Tax=Streptomyces sp. NPDC059892 TaxID=3346989 RepID=UPI00365A6280
MLTLSVTRSRVAAVLDQAATLLDAEGWHPHLNPVISAIDRAAGYTTPGIDPAAEETTLRAWDALVVYLGERLVVPWENEPERTQADVLAALRGAAREVAW